MTEQRDGKTHEAEVIMMRMQQSTHHQQLTHLQQLRDTIGIVAGTVHSALLTA
jgi:hypothetical protein